MPHESIPDKLTRVRNEARATNRVMDLGVTDPLDVPEFIPWAQEYGYIRDRGGRGNVKFDASVWSYGQLQVSEWLVAKRKAQENIRLVVHKERQLSGITTVIQLFLLWLVLFHSHRWSATVAQDKENAAKIHRFIKHYWEHLDGSQKKPGQILADGLELDYPHNSAMFVYTAGSVDTGRSPCLNYVHYSEYAFYEKPEDFRQGITPAIPDEDTWDTVEIVESTAKGENHFKSLLDMGFDEEFPEWHSEFVSWKNEPRCLHVVPKSFKLSEKETAFKAEHDLKDGHLVFWRKQLRKMGGSWERAHQEWPVASFLAFLYTGAPVYKLEILQKWLDAEPANKPAFQGSLIWASKTRAIVDLVPEDYGKLLIFKYPEPGHTYSIGVDTSYGRGRDYHDICVLCNETGEEVAHWRCNTTQPEDMAIHLYRIGVYYNWAEVAVEHNGPGIAVIQALAHGLSAQVNPEARQLSTPYPNLYHDVKDDQDTAQERATIGFQTSSRTKNPATVKSSHDVEHENIRIYSKARLLQMKGYAEDENGKPEQNHKDEHSGLKNDDAIIGLVIANWIRRKWVERGGNRRKPVSKAPWGWEQYLKCGPRAWGGVI